MIRKEDSRRPLAVAGSPYRTVEQAREVSVASIEDRLAALSPEEQIAELSAIDQAVHAQLKDLLHLPDQNPETTAALRGLVRAKHQRANWLTSGLLNQ